MLIAFLIAGAVFADSTPAAADAAQAKPAAAEAKKSDVVCVKEEVTNSRFPRKVCRSRQQAELDKAENRRNLEQAQAQRPLNGH
jgi:hypothetical protein